MAAKDARIQPIYGCKYRALFQFLDSSGDPIAAGSATAVLSRDSADYASIGDTVHEVGTDTGLCYADLAYTETLYKQIKLKVTSTGAIAHIEDLFPQRMPVLHSGTAQAGDTSELTLASGASNKDGAYVGCYLRLSNNTPAGVQGDCHKILTYNGTTKVATVDAAWTDTPTSSTTYEVLVPESLGIASMLVSASELQAELEEDGASVLDTIRDAVTSETYGLSALKTLIDAVPTVAEIQAELEENGASLLDTIRDEVTSATYGLSALKDLIDALPTASEIQTEMEENGASLLDTIRDAVTNVTYGLSALKDLIDALPTASEIQTEMEENGASTLDTIADAIANATYGLSALQVIAAAIQERTDNLPDDPADDSDIDTQLSAIAGYIDTEVASIVTSLAHGTYGLSALQTLLAAINSKTTNLPASPAATGAAMTLSDGAITAAKIASNAITAAKIAANAITASQIASDAITNAKIADDAISAAKIAADAITAAKIADDAIGADQIADGALAEAKFGVVESGHALFAAIRLLLSHAVGDTEDGGLSFRNLADSKDRFTSVVDGSSNRTNTILDAD